MEKAVKHPKRRRWIVTPSFQLPIVIKAVLFAAIGATFFTWSTFYFFWRSLLSTGHATLISALYNPTLWIGWGICLLFSLTLSALIMIKVTHRVAGQMYRFETELDQILAGEQARALHTRKDDYFHEFEETLNGSIIRGGTK